MNKDKRTIDTHRQKVGMQLYSEQDRKPFTFKKNKPFKYKKRHYLTKMMTLYIFLKVLGAATAADRSWKRIPNFSIYILVTAVMFQALSIHS